MEEQVNILLCREWIYYSRSDLSTCTSDTAVIEELDGCNGTCVKFEASELT